MKEIIVLVMHGMSPKDFPPQEKGEFFRLKNQIEQQGMKDGLARFQALENKMRRWPRNTANDPFFVAAYELAGTLQRARGCEVIVGFNEFCAPSMQEALDDAASRKPEKVIVITPMMIRGGSHSEVEIPQDVEAARKRHPGTSFVYVWPYETLPIAEFLSRQIDLFLNSKVKV
jgi:sirohydrochlorin cobaltochelatase